MATRHLAAAVVLTASLVPAGAEAQAPVQFTTKDGNTAVTLGWLAQPSLDVEHIEEGDPGASLCFRRLRFIASGKIARRLKFFVDSDAPHLGVHTDNRPLKREMFLQDLAVTYEVRPEFQVEGGLLMVPLSYNTSQSAASLLAVGYGPYTFLASTPTTSRVGRDQGVQLRGYVRKRLEYRVGAFRGAREIRPELPYRYAARVAWHALEPQTGLFYAGTTLGAKRVLTFGAGIDTQEHYSAKAVDVFLDQPLPSGDAITLQADYIRYDGGRTFRQLAPQHAVLVETGYYFKARRLGAYAQVSRQDVDAPSAADATGFQVGGAYWARGHKLNLKVGVGRTQKNRAPARTQLVLQTQVFAF